MLSKAPRPHTKQKVQNIKVFFEPYIIEDLTSILNKIIEPIVNPAIKKRWITYSNSLLPKNTLGYATQDEYLKTTNLSKENIVQNTIAYVYPDLPKLDISYLIKEFMIFTKKDRILIYTKTDGSHLAIYSAIFYALNYTKVVREIIDKNNKVRSSSHLGIKRSTKWKALVLSEKKALEYRLNHPYFPITNQDEIDKTKLQIFYLETVLNKDYKILIDLFHFANIHFGLDYPLLNLSVKDQVTINQLLNLFNGIKTSNDELVESAMIFLRMKSKITNKDDYKELSESILNIAIQLFNDVYLKGTKRRKKRINHFTYNEHYIDKRIRVKTFIDDMPIYTYSQHNYFNFMEEMVNLVEKSSQGLQNIFEPDLPETNEASEFTLLRSIAEIKRDFNFSKREITSLLTLTETLNQDNEKISNLLTTT